MPVPLVVSESMITLPLLVDVRPWLNTCKPGELSEVSRFFFLLVIPKLTRHGNKGLPVSTDPSIDAVDISRPCFGS